jgi:ATP-binding cassette subfamily B protein
MMQSADTLRWVIKKIRRRVPAVLILTLVSVFSAVFNVLFALGTKNVIDAAVSGDGPAFTTACVKQAIVIIGILTTLILNRHLSERLHANLDKDWKRDLLHVILNSDYQTASAYHSGEFVNRLNNDVRILDDGIVNLLPKLCSMITKLAVAFAVLTSLTPLFAILLLGAGFLVILATAFLRRKLKSMHKSVSEADGKVSSILQETLEKLLVVQAMDISQEMERRVGIQLENRFELHRKRKNISIFANSCISIMFYVAGFVALVWCAAGILAGSITYGTMSAVTQLVNQLQSPIVGLSGILPQYISMIAAAERLQELDQMPATADYRHEDPLDLYSRMKGIRADNLSFTYDRDKIFDNAEFSLDKGNFYAITGPSGTGKSTLLKLMLGVYTPSSGQLAIEIDDRSINLDRSTRRLFAYVPQGNILFSGTIKENLLVIKPNATEEEIDEAVYVSAMDLYLSQLPKGLDTILGEAGAGLSEGQAQRLAIARAVLGGAPILLLDECTSALDVSTEALVLQRLHELKNRTCIAVTHRPAAEHICSGRIQMDSGKIYMK